TRTQLFPGVWLPGVITRTFALQVDDVLAGQVWRLVTYAFLHSEDAWTHIFFNMWMLWLFGGYFQDIFGRWEFLASYLVSALVGGLAYVGAAASGLIGPGYCIGASGAVTATMILCAFYHPRLTILLFFVLPVPIWALAVLQVVQDTLGFLGT